MDEKMKLKKSTKQILRKMSRNELEETESLIKLMLKLGKELKTYNKPIIPITKDKWYDKTYWRTN